MNEQNVKRIPIRDDFFTAPLTTLEEVRLKGTKCNACNEVFFGNAIMCQNCQGEELEGIVFSNTGKLWTYTIITHKPPGDYKGPEPFTPFGVGFVELPEGIRILAPLTGCDVNDLKIGIEMQLSVEKLFEDAEGNEVIAYKFKALTGGAK